MYSQQSTDSSTPPLPTFQNPPSFNDILKNMMGIIDPNTSSQDNNPFNFINSPEFSQTVEQISRGLLQSLSSNLNSDIVNDNKNNRTCSLQKKETNQKKTKNLILELAVSLEDLYRGKNKKITVKRKRTYEQSDGSFKIIEERKNLVVTIPKGARNNHRVVFPEEADEVPGFEKGDVVVVLKEKDHDQFVRCFDDIMVNITISMAELFYFDTVLKLLDGSTVRITNESDDLLSEFGSIRKLSGKGMPIPSNPTTFGDMFIQFTIVPQCDPFPDKNKLQELFPILNKQVADSDINSESLTLVKLEDDDYYKLDLFEEDKCSFFNEEDEDEDEEEEEDDEEEDEDDDVEELEEDEEDEDV